MRWHKQAFFGLSLALGLAAFSACASESEEASRPNILLIMADDLGYSDLGSYGAEIETPTLGSSCRRWHSLLTVQSDADVLDDPCRADGGYVLSRCR